MVNVQRFVLFVDLDEHASNNRSNTSATTSSLENEGYGSFSAKLFKVKVDDSNSSQYKL